MTRSKFKINLHHCCYYFKHAYFFTWCFLYLRFLSCWFFCLYFLTLPYEELFPYMVVVYQFNFFFERRMYVQKMTVSISQWELPELVCFFVCLFSFFYWVILDIKYFVSLRCKTYLFDTFILQYDCHGSLSQQLYCVI